MTDPRIHERRVRVAREKGRARRRILLAGVILAILVAGAFVAVHSSLLGAKHVEVTGDVHTPLPAVVKAAGLEGSPPLVDLSANIIARRLETLPWVKRAKVHISYPTTVRIALVERTPVVAVRTTRSRFLLVDETGRVLQEVSGRPAGYPEILATAGGLRPGEMIAPRLRALARLAAAMPEKMVGQTDGFELDAGAPALEVSSSLVALFGSPAAAAAKYVSLATVLSSADLSGIATVDLETPANPTLIAASSRHRVAANVGG